MKVVIEKTRGNIRIDIISDNKIPTQDSMSKS